MISPARRKSLLTWALVLPLLLGGAVSSAAPKESSRFTQSNAVSLEQAASMARRTYGGRVLSATRVEGGYRIRLLLDGSRVKTVHVPGNSRSKR